MGLPRQRPQPRYQVTPDLLFYRAECGLGGQFPRFGDSAFEQRAGWHAFVEHACIQELAGSHHAAGQREIAQHAATMREILLKNRARFLSE